MKVQVTYELDIPDELILQDNINGSINEILFDYIENKARVANLENERRLYANKDIADNSPLKNALERLYKAQSKLYESLKCIGFNICKEEPIQRYGYRSYWEDYPYIMDDDLDCFDDS